MKTHLLIKVLIISLLLLSGCSASKFTSDNILKLKIGMTSTEVIEIFGKPIKTEANTCGAGVGKPWTCISWYYGEYRPRFVFVQEIDGVLYLNSWEM
jgi:hypothetical protein